MSKTIWKFTVPIIDRPVTVMPRGAEILHVGMQGDACCLWALVDPGEADEERAIRIYDTGHPVEQFPGRHIGTFMAMQGRLVFHAFEPTP